ncbi:unnamed protein product [Cuscuta campestris]|uniref:Uncharacterized protein n=1 Tax=Cuscuta campestris TaxID=132261 RepID=A0A484MCH8_9ASTE|nr:unnamed protein product [Cuscuta campestris]
MERSRLHLRPEGRPLHRRLPLNIRLRKARRCGRRESVLAAHDRRDGESQRRLRDSSGTEQFHHRSDISAVPQTG